MTEPDAKMPAQSAEDRLLLRRSMRQIADDVKRDDVRRNQEKLNEAMENSDKLLADIHQSREGQIAMLNHI